MLNFIHLKRFINRPNSEILAIKNEIKKHFYMAPNALARFTNQMCIYYQKTVSNERCSN